MRSMKIFVFLVACLFMISLSACGKESSSSEQPTATTTTVWAASVPTTRDLLVLLTEAEAESAMETDFGSSKLLENGSLLQFCSEDYADRVELLLDKQPQSRFDSVIALYGEGMLTETPNLGDVAYWSVHGELLVYAKEYMISVNVQSGHLSEDSLLTAARQMAALVVERL